MLIFSYNFKLLLTIKSDLLFWIIDNNYFHKYFADIIIVNLKNQWVLFVRKVGNYKRKIVCAEIWVFVSIFVQGKWWIIIFVSQDGIYIRGLLTIICTDLKLNKQLQIIIFCCTNN